MLTETEIKFLKDLIKRGGWAVSKYYKEQNVHPTVLSLKERGYIKFTKVLCGPLQTVTGDIGLQITEASRFCLQGKNYEV